MLDWEVMILILLIFEITNKLSSIGSSLGVTLISSLSQFPNGSLTYCLRFIFNYPWLYLHRATTTSLLSSTTLLLAAFLPYLL